jgi:pimeloyl-ACP methyl ester carboxylesterase
VNIFSKKLLIVATVCLISIVLIVVLTKEPTYITGAYEFNNGQIITISPSQGNTYRYRNLNTGESQQLYPSKNLVYYSGPGWASDEPIELLIHFVTDSMGSVTGVEWQQEGKPTQYANKIALREEYVKFQNGDISLHGKLVLPLGAGPFPVVVIVHGSEKDAASQIYYEPYLYASHNIACFVYDKRGTGDSSGKFTMDFYKLADDVLAAVDWLSLHDEIDIERIGLAGYSQGGWIAPLAASQSESIKFVLVGYGTVESPFQEDRSETLNAIQAAGYTDDDLEKAKEVISAVHALVASDLSEGWEHFNDLKEKYNHEPWVVELDAGMSGSFFQWPRGILTTIGRRFFPPGLIWEYDSIPVLEQVEIPMLWVLGSGDEEAPNDVTIGELENLRQQGRPIEVKIYSNAGHGIIEFQTIDGERVYTGYPSDYFQYKVNWVFEQVGEQKKTKK